MYLKQQRVTKAPIVAFYKLHKPGDARWESIAELIGVITHTASGTDAERYPQAVSIATPSAI
jgi:hypothetical protein